MPGRGGGDLEMVATSSVVGPVSQGPPAWRRAGAGLATLVAALALLAVFATAARQHSAAVAPISAPTRLLTAQSTKRALVFQSGGFLAMADLFGATAGLLAVFGRMEDGEATLDGLLDGFGTVSAISGGAWFATQLAYSARSQDVLYKMAAEPNQAGSIFKSQWVAKAFSASRPDISGSLGNVFECLSAVLGLLAPGQPQENSDIFALLAQRRVEGQGTWYLEVLVQVLILFATESSITWDSLIALLMKETGGIDDTVLLGTDKVNTWARGKRLIFGTTVITPNGTASGDLSLGTRLGARVDVFSPDASEAISYTAQGGDGASVPHLIPAKISIVPGEADIPPEPFCGQEGCFNVSLVYEGKPAGATARSQPLGDIFRSAFEDNAASLPVHSVAAAASAALFPQGVNGLDASQKCLDLAVWGTGAGGGQSFRDGDGIRSSLFADPAAFGDMGDTVNKLADSGLFALGDGAGTDETGLGHALSTGVDRITLFLNNDITGLTDRLGDNGFYRFMEAFPSASGDTSFRTFFSSPSAAEFGDLYVGFNRIMPADGTPFLRSIAYGSVDCVTRDNPFFGLRAGRRVTLSVVAVETVQITIGQLKQGYSYASFFDYATLAGHVVETLASQEHDEEVRGLVLDFFL